MEAEVILDGVRAEEDDPLSRDHQNEAVKGLWRENLTIVSSHWWWSRLWCDLIKQEWVSEVSFG